jgi:ABC-type transport system substrate-binding protein
MLLEAHASWARVDDRPQIAGLLFTTARWFASAGRPADAVRAVARSAAVYADMGGSMPAYDEAPVRELLDEARSELAPEDYEAAWASGTDGSTADIVAQLSP